MCSMNIINIFHVMIFIMIWQVKLIVNLKGRENEFKSNAIELIRRFRDDVGEVQGHWLLFAQ